MSTIGYTRRCNCAPWCTASAGAGRAAGIGGTAFVLRVLDLAWPLRCDLKYIHVDDHIQARAFIRNTLD